MQESNEDSVCNISNQSNYFRSVCFLGNLHEQCYSDKVLHNSHLAFCSITTTPCHFIIIIKLKSRYCSHVCVHVDYDEKEWPRNGFLQENAYFLKVKEQLNMTWCLSALNCSVWYRLEWPVLLLVKMAYYHRKLVV